MTTEWYFRPEGRGVLMGMGKWPTEDLDIQFSPEMMDEIIEAAVHRVPILEQATVQTAWTGIRSLTPDERPILGPVSAVDGFILNCGWGGTGIIQAPIAGQLVAEYVVQGYTSTMDIGPLTLGRFEERATEDEGLTGA
jgi:glycine/D-amino acid oxidase-like deaminating enzyme